MKHILILLTVLIVGCNAKRISNTKNYESNKALAEKWVQTFETGNLDLWKEVVSKDLLDVAPLYGMGQVNYDQSLQIAEFYVNNYINVKFNDPVWLPGIDTATLKPDGSVRAYGVWTGESISTGRTFEINSYHNFDFKDGKITSTGEYFDATGMVNAVGPIQKHMVVVALKVKKGNYEKVQELMKLDEGLKTTRNYEGCLSVESFYNEESSTYFVVENWDAPDRYENYLNWRLNEDPSKLAERLTSLLVGGEKGLVPYYNNKGYGYY